MKRAGIACDCCGRTFTHDDRGTYIGYEIFCKNCFEYHEKKKEEKEWHSMSS